MSRIVTETRGVFTTISWWPNGSHQTSTHVDADGLGGTPIEQGLVPPTELMDVLARKLDQCMEDGGRVRLFVGESTTVEQLAAEMRLARHATEALIVGVDGLRSLNLFADHLSELDKLTLDNCNTQRSYKQIGQWPIDISALRSLSSLKHLVLRGEREVQCKGLLEQVRTVELRQLAQYIPDEDPQCVALDFLAAFPGVEDLTLAGFDVSNMEPITRCAGLRRLCISYMTSRVPFEQHLGQLPLLESLEIASNDALSFANELAAKNLSCLSLGAQSLRGLDFIASLTELRQLRVSTTQGGKADALPSLANLAKLEDLALGSDAWATLPEMPRGPLQTINLAASRFTDLESLASCCQLRTLGLGGATIPGLAPLASAQMLQEIYCVHSNLDAAKLEPLLSRPALEIVWGTATKKWSPKRLTEFFEGRLTLPQRKDAVRGCSPLKSKNVPKKQRELPLSRWGGPPSLGPADTWPACEVCGAPFTLVLQLDLGALPESDEAGLFQFLYCEDCGVGSPGAYSPKVMRLRVLAVAKGFQTAAPPAGAETKRAKAITVLAQNKDRPGDEDFETIFDSIATTSAQAKAGDKIHGWPRWIHSPEWPSCATCGNRMDLFAQFASNNLFSWGDNGNAYVFRCAEHRDRFGFCQQG